MRWFFFCRQPDLTYLDQNGDRFSIGEDLVQRLGAEYVAECGGGKQLGRLGCVLDIDDRYDRVEYAKVDDGVHRHGHRVFGEYLLRWNVESHRSQVDFGVRVDARQPFCCCCCHAFNKLCTSCKNRVKWKLFDYTKNMPGPFAPPVSILPSRNMTALINSFVCFVLTVCIYLFK